jgi:hypothetical protein
VAGREWAELRLGSPGGGIWGLSADNGKQLQVCAGNKGFLSAWDVSGETNTIHWVLLNMQNAASVSDFATIIGR